MNADDAMTEDEKAAEVERAATFAKSARSETQVSVGVVVTRANGDVVNIGIVNYWHKNPLRRLGHRLFRAPIVNHRIHKFNRANRKLALQG